MTDTTFQILLSRVPQALRPAVQNAWGTLLEHDAETVTEFLIHNESLLASLVRTWVVSPFVLNNCLRQPELLKELLQQGDLLKSATRSDYEQRLSSCMESAETEAEHMIRLRRFRLREMIRIAWRDISAWVDLDETLLNLSDLAEVCVQAALTFAYNEESRKHGVPLRSNGTPQALVVLGMGKLGAWELNFSSDIDLIFTYPEDGTLENRKQTTYSEFFTRVCRTLIRMIDSVTENGFVFRVDTRLRPFGNSGPLVMSFEAMEAYYQGQAREWERYAMVKARPIAGDLCAGLELMHILQPFVYRKYLDYSAFGALRELKHKITQELKRKERLQNIKLGPGGIREIEFIGQAFQMVYGGKDPALQERRIQSVLVLLGQRGVLDASVVDRLVDAYRYLRIVENRLQQAGDQQVHDLPVQPMERDRLAYAMELESWPAFEQKLQSIRGFIHRVFQQVFVEQTASQATNEAEQIWLSDDPDVIVLTARALGYSEPAQVLDITQSLKRSRIVKNLSRKALATLDQLMPLALIATGACEQSEVALKRLVACIEAIASRQIYLLLLVENPVALTQLVKLTASSCWIAQYIEKHPVLLDDLLEPRALYAPLSHQELSIALENRLKRSDDTDLEQIMIALRQFKDSQVLRIAAADIMEIIPLMTVSDYLTWIAEVILQAVVKLAWRLTVERYGAPPVETSTAECNSPGFAVCGYGKLGGIELGYGSDLDLVFLYDCVDPNAFTDGTKPISSSEFYIRLGRRIINLLNTEMMAGVLYEVDMRLRPSGSAGLLVSQVDAYEQYQHQNAWSWEHQALVRARFICGDFVLKGRFDTVRQQILSRPRNQAELKQAVQSMRDKMRESLSPKEYSGFHLKQSSGGMVDIEFMVQYCVLAYAEVCPDLTSYTDNVRLLKIIQENGFLMNEDADFLQKVYREYRNINHRMTLQGHSAIVKTGQFTEQRRRVETIWQQLMA